MESVESEERWTGSAEGQEVAREKTAGILSI